MTGSRQEQCQVPIPAAFVAMFSATSLLWTQRSRPACCLEQRGCGPILGYGSDSFGWALGL